MTYLKIKNMRNLKITLIAFFLVALSANAQSMAANTPKLTDPITNCELRYYYYPNLEAYYDIKKNIYYFKQQGEWITASEIPNGYRGYSLFNKIRVAITDYDDEDPTQFIGLHKKQYPYSTNGKIKNMMAVN